VRFKLPNPKKEKKPAMQNITINIPNIYDKNIQKLIEMKVVPSRSEAIRTALREFFRTEFDNLQLLGYFDE
jgi:Arc/MetJ-type ribon-helix-helix transcriptional regulator